MKLIVAISPMPAAKMRWEKTCLHYGEMEPEEKVLDEHFLAPILGWEKAASVWISLSGELDTAPIQENSKPKLNPSFTDPEG